MTTEIRKARDKAAKALQGDVSRVKALQAQITSLTSQLDGVKNAVQKGTALLSKLDEVLTLEGAPAKRGPGRPPKAAAAQASGVKLNKDGTPRKKPGRKPKVEAKAKRGPGRPPKAVKAASADGTVKYNKDGSVRKKPGRKPKGVKAAAAPAKRGPGRPPKAAAGVKLNKDGTPRKKPGRKPKAVVEAKAKRGPGRPPKAKAVKAEGGVKLNKDGTPRKKPGRKPKAVVEAKAEGGGGVKLNKDGTPRKKPGRKPKAVAADAEVEAPATEAKAETAAAPKRGGRKGSHPSLKESLRTVLASGEPMNLDAILAALKDRGLTPDSDDPRTYVNYILSTTKDSFERSGRGVYRLKGDAPVAPEPEEAGSASEPADEAAPSTGSVLEQAEAMLSAL